jgi:N-acetylneuraminate lyase
MLKLDGLVAATYAPYTASGEVNLAIIEKQAAGLVADGCLGAFVNGTTGECSSLTVNERMLIAERWLTVAKGSSLKIVVHIGVNCQEDSKALAAHAEKHGAVAVAAVAPSYFKPRDAIILAEGLAAIAAACPKTPFYYYDIPVLTGVTIPAHAVLTELGKRAKNLNGAKFTNPDLAGYQLCLNSGPFDMPYGIEEALLGAIAVGAVGAVGSSFNFTGLLYNRLFRAVQGGDWQRARALQLHGTKLLAAIAGPTFLPASKVIMQDLGLDLGPCRWPVAPMTPQQESDVRSMWERVKAEIR